jgi:glyoxylate reductase
MKVFITSEIPQIAVEILKKKKFDVIVFSGKESITYSQLKNEVKDADGIISLLTDKFDEEIIQGMNRCKIIANYAVGFNNINVTAANRHGITVTNTPDVLTDSTADLAMTLVLACSRRMIEGEELIRSGRFKGWKPKLLLGIELKNKNFGIIGAGRIGTAVARRAAGFGVNLFYYNGKENSEIDSMGGKKLPLNALLKKCDIISLHLPLTESTFHILNKERLYLLKSSAVLINTSRGEIIDEKELIEILKAGRIFSVGLDVYENEPSINPELYNLKNAVLLPHIGSATEDARNNMANLAAQNVISVLSGKGAITPVLI